MTAYSQLHPSASGFFPVLLSLETGDREAAHEGVSRFLLRPEPGLFSLGAGCFLAGRYSRSFSLNELPPEWTGAILNGLEAIGSSFTSPQPSPLSGPSGEFIEDVHVSVLATLYGGIRQCNSYLKDIRLQSLAVEIRSWVFGNLLRGGTVCGDTRLKDGDFGLLMACEPFGLFEPEDLVLVEAVRALKAELTSASAFSRLLMALYWTEQGSYGDARIQLELAGPQISGTTVAGKAGEGSAAADSHSTYADADDDVSALRDLVRLRLNRLGQYAGEDEGFILHRPGGNRNRYNPGLDERIPYLVRAGEPVEIRVVTHPAGPGHPVELLVESPERGSEALTGEFFSDPSPFTRFSLDAFSRTQTLSYRFRLHVRSDKTAESPEFSLDILACRRITDFRFLQSRGTWTLNDDETGPLRVNCSDGFFSIEPVRPVSAAASASAAAPQAVSVAGYSDTGGTTDGDHMQAPDTGEPFRFPWPGGSLELSCLYLWYRSDGEVLEIEADLLKEPGESFYGFGERFNAFDQSGEVPDVYVFNQYKDQGLRTYIPMPYYLSSRGYGLYLDTQRYCSFDLGALDPALIRIRVEDDRFRLHCFPGMPADVIRAFTTMTGRPDRIPRWALGPWMSSNNWDNQREVLRQAGLTAAEKIPSTVLVIEAWSDEATFYLFNDAVYREIDGAGDFTLEDFSFPADGRWPDPRGMVETLHGMDLRCILWQIPVIKRMRSLANLQRDRDEAYAVSEGFAVRNADGSPYRIPEDWFKDSLILDFTNPGARDWWFGRRRYLVRDIGVDGFKTDGGECVFGQNLVFHDGRSGREMRNAYPNEYIGAYHAFLGAEHPEGGLTFSRSGFTGCGRFPAHWAGDERSTFDAFRRSLLAGLSAGISGIPFWGWDLAGFSGEIPSAELYIRSAQMAAFCPIMQYHAESKAQFNQDRTPWNIAERRRAPRVLELYRYYANLRMNLLPYLDQEARRASEDGLPMMRALVIDYPDDAVCRGIHDEYLLGESLLVAPVIEEGATRRSIYLPGGQWADFFTGELLNGGRWIQREAALEQIPVFIREQHVIPLQLPPSQKPGEYGTNRTDGWNSLTLMVHGDDLEYELEDEGKPRVRIRLQGDSINLEIGNPYPAGFTVCLLSPAGTLRINGKESISDRKQAGRYLHYMPIPN